jgi:hypothetical protein
MFYGTFLWSDPASDIDFRYRLSAPAGFQDVMYDHVFAGRSATSGLWAQQMAMAEGGFRSYTPLGQTWKWIWAVNIESPVPGRLPIRLYLDAGTYAGAGKLPGTSEVFLYDAGIKIVAINDIFDISFPLVVSNDIQKVKDLYSNKYWQSIRFTLHLERVDPWEIINNIGF